MTTIFEQNILEHSAAIATNIPKNWEKSIEEVYSCDDIIAAYLDGKKAAQREESDKRVRHFLLNVKLATSIAEELYSILEEKDFDLKSIHLKSNDINNFEALYLVGTQNFLSDIFRNAYINSSIIEKKYNSDKFHVSFSFSSDDGIDNDTLSSDGFFIKYEKRTEA